MEITVIGYIYISIYWDTMGLYRDSGQENGNYCI